jgi:hypothetical protein
MFDMAEDIINKQVPNGKPPQLANRCTPSLTQEDRFLKQLRNEEKI